MSPEAGTGHSNNNPESEGSMEGKELEPWLMQLMRERLLALSSLSREHLTMPPIASYVRQKLGNFNPRALNMSIVRPGSISSLIKPAGLSSVWRRLIDMPLLRLVQRRSQLIQTSLNINEEQPFSNLDLRQSESLPEKYLASEPAVGEEQLNPVSPELSPMFKEPGLSGRVVEGILLPTADSPQRSVPSPSITGQSGQMINRSGTAGASEPALPPVTPIGIPSFQQFGQIQRYDLRQVDHTEDRQPKNIEYHPPAYDNRQSDNVGSHFVNEPSLERGEHLLTETDEQAESVPTKRWLEKGWASITEGARQVADITRAAISRQIVPLVHPVSVLRRSHRIAGDKAIDSGAEVPQPPYIIDSSGVDKIAATDNLSGQSPDSYQSLPGRQTEEGVSGHTPDPSLHTTYQAVIGKPEHLSNQMAIVDIDKPVIGLRLPSIMKHDHDLEYSGAGNIHSRFLKAGQPVKSISSESPLLGILAKKVRAVTTDKDSENLPAQEGAVMPTVLPTGEATSLAVERTEMPLVHPYTAEYYDKQSPATSDFTKMTVSPVQRYWKSTEVPPIDNDRDSNTRLPGVQASSSLSRKTAGSSLERLYVSSFVSETVPDENGVKGVPRATDTGFQYDESQRNGEPALTLVKRQAEEAPPEPSLTPVMRYTEAVSRQPDRSAGEEGEAKVSREADIPDIDAIARDVYSILKRTIRRERERTYGFS